MPITPQKYENPWLFSKVCESALVWISKELRSSQLLITMTSSPVIGDTLKSWNFYIITKRFYPLVFGHGLGYKAKWQRWAFKVLSFLCNFHHIYINSNFVVNNYILDFWLDYLTFFWITDEWVPFDARLKGFSQIGIKFAWKFWCKALFQVKSVLVSKEDILKMALSLLHRV